MSTVLFKLSHIFQQGPDRIRCFRKHASATSVGWISFLLSCFSSLFVNQTCTQSTCHFSWIIYHSASHPLFFLNLWQMWKRWYGSFLWGRELALEAALAPNQNHLELAEERVFAVMLVYSGYKWVIAEVFLDCQTIANLDKWWTWSSVLSEFWRFHQLCSPTCHKMDFQHISES